LFPNQDLLEPVRADVEDEQSVAAAVVGAQGVVNAVSLYLERGGRTFRSVHVRAAASVAVQARRAGVRNFAHVSGIRETICEWRSLIIFSRSAERFDERFPRRSDWSRGCSGRS
jgi:uncharacterized protein YbjT (DUF2867 family)